MAAILLASTAAALCTVWTVRTRPPSPEWQGPPIKDRLNPNTAGAGPLMQLPGMGPARAEALVRYRQEVLSHRPGPVFKEINDLMAVPGLGPANVRQMAPYLEFGGP